MDYTKFLKPMKTHFERVYHLRAQKESQERKIRIEHLIGLIVVFILLVSIVLLGALVRGFYAWVDSTSPVIQAFIILVPMGAFAFWRLRKMLKL